MRRLKRIWYQNPSGDYFKVFSCQSIAVFTSFRDRQLLSFRTPPRLWAAGMPNH
jgi:hypothetical protein